MAKWDVFSKTPEGDGKWHFRRTVDAGSARAATNALRREYPRVYASGGQIHAGYKLKAQRSNPSNRVVKSLTLRNMALVTIQRLPGGAVKVSGRKMAGRDRKR